MILLNNVRGETLSVSVSDIIYAKSHGNKCIICTKSNTDTIVVRENFEEVLKKIEGVKTLSRQ